MLGKKNDAGGKDNGKYIFYFAEKFEKCILDVYLSMLPPDEICFASLEVISDPSNRLSKSVLPAVMFHRDCGKNNLRADL